MIMKLKFHWMLPKGGEVVVNSRQTPRQATCYRIEANEPGTEASKPDKSGGSD
jgi:hypothetical protein